ncbi:MAG: hypothetical protein GY757_42435, partial [bacterium]|nr:hypothetical protein [bacterium]
MKTNLTFCILTLMGVLLAFAAIDNKMDVPEPDSRVNSKVVNPKVVQPVTPVKPDINFGEIPLYFITNKGQVNKQAKFYAKASRYTLWLTKEGLIFDSSNKAVLRNKTKKRKNPQAKFYSQASRLVERDVSRLMFLNSNKNIEMVSMDESKLKVNYFIGNDKSKWHNAVPTSKAVLYKELYKSIDLKVYGLEKEIEYDWIVKPGGNSKNIKFRYKNIKGSRIDKDGNLLIETKFGELMHKKPVSYQEIDGQRKEVIVTFKRLSKNTYGFEAGHYDRDLELVIDPVVLAYSTYLGTEVGTEYSNSIAVDGNGCAYVTGATNSQIFPTLNQYQGDQVTWDVFVTKLDTNQSGAYSLLYSTYLGGGENDEGYEIAVDGSGNAYVTGYTNSTNFPTLNQYQGDQGTSDVFVTRLDTTQSGASSLLYSTYLGGGAGDFGRSITADANGNVYVTGKTHSPDFPTLNQYHVHQGTNSDAFVTRLDTNQVGAASLLYSTCLGGGDHDWGNAIVVDGNGNACVTGRTVSTNFPTFKQYEVEYQGGASDAFVTRLDTNQVGTAALLYSTYLGGTSEDIATGIAIDGRGYAYVTGYTSSSNFPARNQYQEFQGARDVFVTMLDMTASGIPGLLYSTYLGGGSDDCGYSIAVDGSGRAYVTGYTESTDFPTLNHYQGAQGLADVFVTRLDTAQSGASSLIDSTYLGGAAGDFCFDIALDGSGSVYLTGYIDSMDFPTLNQYQDHQGQADGFVTKLSFSSPKTIAILSPNGGEEWANASIQAITWTGTGTLDPLKITLWKDGLLLGNIADNIDPNTNSYTWTAGLHSGGTAEPGTGYTIKIEENGSTVSDDSDAAFTLSNDSQATVLLMDGTGTGISGGVVQYYNSGWQSAGTTDENGRLTIALSPLKAYVFRMTYEGASINLTQDLANNPVVTFKTVNATVQLKDSNGNPLDTGAVHYYAGGWKTFGTTSNGETKKELLPVSYVFRMSYGGAALNKTHDLSAGPVVLFQTTAATVQLKDSSGNPLDTGSVQYYASGWKTFGITSGGEAKKELLPLSYVFRMSYGGTAINKTHDLSAEPVVRFQTTAATVQLKDSSGNPLDTGSVQYYAGGWKTFGITSGGETTKELLPLSYVFRMSYGGTAINKTHDLSAESVVRFQTTAATVQLKDSSG